MHPNSLANLRAPWQPGETAVRNPAKVDRALKTLTKATPKAALLIARSIDNPELPISTRLRCAEYVLDHTLPKDQPGIAIGQGVEWLELRFVAPGGQAAESHRIAFQEAEVLTLGEEETEA
jgi:hypothetical protein